MDGLHFTRELLDGEGMTIHELLKACRDGDWERVRRGAYVKGHDLDERRRHLCLIAATIPGVRDGSVVSHASAAILHGLPVARQQLDRVWMTRAVGGHGRHGSVLHLRHCQITPDEVTDVGGVPVTTLERTAIDLARNSKLEWGVIACDAALAQGLDRLRLLEAASRARGWPGARRAERAATFADGSSQSPLESVSRLQLQRLGFPTPRCQFPVWLDGRVVATSDFGWEDPGLVGECDGRVKYGELLEPGELAADAVMREKRREERIRAAGYWIVRWGWEEAWNPASLRRIVQRGFELAPAVRRAS
jgi:hypothetical protein